MLVIIAAPSGTGKTTVIRRFLEAHPDMVHSVSCTTRPPRRGESDGRDYHFISRREFEEGISDGRFAEWAEVHGHLYGTPKEPLERWLSEGKKVLLDLDVVGSLKLKSIYKERAISIFLEPPSIEELERRLRSRATDTEEQMRIRMRNAMEELSHRGEFDRRVVNDDIERACREIEGLIGGSGRR